MSLDCTTPRYDALYARWLERPGDLLDLARYQPGDKLLDLCGGTGTLSRDALRRGADPDTITLLDRFPRAHGLHGIRVVRADAEDVWKALGHEHRASFNVVACRQAINYVDLERYGYRFFRDVSYLLAPNGRFVFNTFRRPKWSARTYTFRDRRYFEASGYFGRTVFHLQATPGRDGGIDASRFRWYPEAYLHERMPSNLYSDIHRTPATDRWVLTRVVDSHPHPDVSEW